MKKSYYKGILPIGSLELDCYVLDDEQNTRILSQNALFKAFDRPRRGTRAIDPIVVRENDRIKLPPFMASKALQPYLTKEIIDLIRPIDFLDGKSIITGYNANLLPEICNLYLSARRDGHLTKNQEAIATQSEILLTAFAKVGIVALIDEATGFQRDRKHDALRLILEKYVEEGIQKWVKTFPDRFFEDLDKLYKNEKTISQKRPQYYGKFINTFIYEPLEHGYVKERLNELNVTDEGKRKARFHQWLTGFGKTQLTLQLGKIMGLMEISPNIRAFKERQARLEQPSLFEDIFDEKNNNQ